MLAPTVAGHHRHLRQKSSTASVFDVSSIEDEEQIENLNFDVLFPEHFEPSKKDSLKLRYSGNVINTNLESLVPLLNLNIVGLKNRPNENEDLKEASANIPKYLKLNVGGTSYRLRCETVIKRCKKSLLYRMVFLDHQARMEIADDYLETTEEYFFERSALVFNAIYQYYVSGVCHRPRDICLDIFITELAFWNVTEGLYGECCWPKPIQTNMLDGSVCSDTKVADFQNVCCGKLREAIWNLIEVPESSFAARVVSFCSIVAVLTSNIGLILGSIPELQVTYNKSREISFNKTEYYQLTLPHPTLDVIEACCVIWFTFEYLGKIIVAVDRKKVFWEVLNVIDLIAIIPFYIELLLHLIGVDANELEELKGAILVVRILRVLRVIRIFKLGKYSSGLRAFAKTLQASMHQLSMLVVVLVTAIMFFSTFVYFLEKDEPDSHFPSIPSAFWWCIVTMTTVGYGDVVPKTIAGKLVASGAIASGILVLALPITIIVDNFMKVQEETDEMMANLPPNQSITQSNSPEFIQVPSENSIKHTLQARRKTLHRISTHDLTQF